MDSKKTSELDLVSYLRGLASLGVVLYHVRHDMWVGLSETLNHGNTFNKLTALLSIPCAYLGSGVLLFFVISGFCIHFPHSGVKGRELNLRTYCIRRFLRIYPPYFVAILTAFIVEYIGFRSGHLEILSISNSLGSIFLLQDLTGGQPACNGPLWTISVEIGFYILFPFIYNTVKSQSRKTLAIAAGLSLVSVAFDLFGFQNTLTKVFGYWFIWVMGANLAESYTQGNLEPPSIKILFAAFVVLSIGVFFTTADLLKLGEIKWGKFAMIANCSFGIAAFVGLWWCLSRRERLPHLSAPFSIGLSFLGDISYSLYLVHTPFFLSMSWLWQSLFGHKPENFLVSLCFCLGAIAVAYCFYRMIELPSHRFARNLVNKQLSNKL